MARCPACGSEAKEPPSRNAARPFDQDGIGSARLRVARIRLATCGSCGMGWQVDPPSEGALTAAYSAMQDDVYVAEADNRRLAFERSVRLLQRYGAREGQDLLDVGCSAGIFLDVAIRHGWDAWGVEPSRWMSDKARALVGDRVYSTTFEEAPLEARRFHIVTMWDVLEHVPNLAAFLDRAREACRPGGLLVINVPARDSWVARAFGKRWPLILPEHLFYFSRRSLQILLDRAGFETLGFHKHLVFFSAGYVIHRLGQHVLPELSRRATAAAHATRMVIPLLMGEVTVVARSRP